ncbi:MAG TPA: phosphatase PAP2 family protein [Mycobacteriales bacterium]|nr:phosphatase PAP2 family protein [Mycobacteriales bacterium]
MATLSTEAPPPAQVESPWSAGGPEAQLKRRRLLIAFAVLFAVVSALLGFPTGREIITAWVFLFLFAACAGDWIAWRRAVVRDWLPIVGILFAYDALRGLADGNAARAHVLPMLRADEWLFGGTVPTVTLQRAMWDGDPSWWDFAITPIYLSHFVVPMGLLAVLWARSYPAFRRVALIFILLTVATLATYALFPAAPPWWAYQEAGVLPPVDRVVSETLQSAGIEQVRSAVIRGKDWANPVAAIPSLHSAVPFMVLLLGWSRARLLGRSLLVAYVLAMTFTLTYAGEHYVVDAFVGWLYAAAAVWAGSRLMRLPRFGGGKRAR